MNRDQPEMTDAVYEQVKEMGKGMDKDIYVIEAGSHKEGRSKYMTHWFWDPFYRGRYYAFNKGLKIAQKNKDYDYYWFLCNDVIFPKGQDVLKELVEVMEKNLGMAQIGPAEPDADDYYGCHPRKDRRWHKAATIHGLAVLMRKEAIKDVGYCTPKLRYSQGASAELAYLLYKNGWFLAYSDRVSLKHRGTTTYGKVVPISRHEYLRRSRRDASKYLRKKYGEHWDKLFSSVLPKDIEVNTFPWMRQVWEKKLTKEHPYLWTKFKKFGSKIKKFVLKKIQ